MDDNLDGWIPQCGTMRLLSRMLEADDTHAVAEVDITGDGLFTRDGQVPVWIGIEYMAQTIAAWSAGRGRRAGKRCGPKPGLLLGARRYTAHCNGFGPGATLRIEVHCEVIGDNGLGVFACRILQDGQTLATAAVSVLEPHDLGAVFSAGVAT